MPESPQGSEKDNKECDAATHFPEIIFGFGGVNYAGKIHAIIGGEEGEGKKYDGDDGENEDGFVLAVGDYR